MRRLAVAVSLLAAACGGSNSGTGDDGGGDGDVDGGDLPDGGDPGLCTGGSLCGIPLECCPAGNECVLDQCVTTCETGIYCGANLDTCCNSGDICLANACVTPGAPCNDSYDCEPGFFCEPTLMQCAPQPDPNTCKLEPTFTSLDVTLEHSYTDGEIISIPVVANLDGAGAPEIVVNLTKYPAGGGFGNGAIVVLNGNDLSVKLGPILESRNGATPTYASHGRKTIAVGDVDGDDLPDIVYAAATSNLGPQNGAGASGSVIVAIKGTGELIWFSHLPGTPTTRYSILGENGAVTLSNFDGDKNAEVMFGGTLIDHDGTVIWDGGGTNGTGGNLGSESGYAGGIANVADLDADGKPEIITGRQAWKVNWNNGTPTATTVTQMWIAPAGVADGYPAIADLNADGKPDVALVSASKITLLDGQTGAYLCAKADPTTCGASSTAADRVQPIGVHIPASVTNPNLGANRGGPPTVADFDGDGRPEIAVAGGYSYSVYDLFRNAEDTTVRVTTPVAGQMYVRWTARTQDLSSNATGSSVFDFQGDGASEVVYQDECYARVYSGVDGTLRLQQENTSGTIHEYPLVVDADGDGNSEILVVANNSSCSGVTQRQGLYMYGDANDRWVPTRKVWTQHSYHVTNAGSDGNVPMTEANNWETPGLNDYRKNAQGEGVFNAPNLTVELAIGLEACETNQLRLRARVTNVGSLGVFPGTVVQFRLDNATGTVLGSGTVTTPLLPGGSALVTLDVPSVATGQTFWVGVDGAPTTPAMPGDVLECNEADNEDSASGASCPVIN